MSHDGSKKRVSFSSATQIEEIEYEAEIAWDSAMCRNRNEARSETNRNEAQRESTSPSGRHPHRAPESLKECDQQMRCKYPSSADDDVVENRGSSAGLAACQRRRQKQRVIKSVLIAQATARDHVEGQDELDVERFIAFFAAKESHNARALAASIGRAMETAVLQLDERQQQGNHIGRNSM
jgi:hypothetical protein